MRFKAARSSRSSQRVAFASLSRKARAQSVEPSLAAARVAATYDPTTVYHR